MAQPNQRPAGEDFQERAVAWGLGLNFAYGVIGFFLVGWAVQAWLWKDAAPWPMLVGLGRGRVPLCAGRARDEPEVTRQSTELLC
ncbi:MAG: hypothetical protein ACOYN0_18750 [Phycisphaerales bacterium]